MAVPRRKHSRSRRDKRKSQQALKKPARSLCPNCGEMKPPHNVCPKCGYYKDREVVEIHEV
ncbi:MAG: 50S ribosomal protein L32 [Deltaproteobacteria bacterium]|uniref:Large ribosomal subunit protein bL32 n=1 Tax=Candidatus Zymogenus saltonus TaxID=2844893 RepID=A0A9D8KG58_9DELT|nr:50S ribosomal protein L32 [Candidatus Zymogenus saltonus]